MIATVKPPNILEIIFLAACSKSLNKIPNEKVILESKNPGYLLQIKGHQTKHQRLALLRHQMTP